jgi:SAM-dependent methyltransferase
MTAAFEPSAGQMSERVGASKAGVPAEAKRRHSADTATPFDASLRGLPARLLRSDGTEVVLAVRRWHADATGDDNWLLDRCAGPVIDLGCGPGRLVVALTRRGIPALGVDVSAAAVAQCRARGAAVLRRNLFAGLPGRWQHALLADGNIGIGGNPVRLLRRAAALLRPGGTVLVETDPDPAACWSGTAQVHTPEGAGPPLRWAVVGADALREVAAAAGLGMTGAHVGPRCFSELRASARPPSAS